MTGERRPSTALRGIDTWAPFNAGSNEGGSTREIHLFDWLRPAPVTWSITLRGRQRDYYGQDAVPFPADWPAGSYAGSTVIARVLYDDEYSRAGPCFFDCDVGAQTNLWIPPTKRCSVSLLVAEDWQGENGVVPADGQANRPARAMEIVAYGRPLFEPKGDWCPLQLPARDNVLTLTDWVIVPAGDEYLRAMPRGAVEVTWGSRDQATGGPGPGLTGAFDWNRNVTPAGTGGGPILPEDPAAHYRVPQCSAWARFRNASTSVDLTAAIVWRIKPC